MYVQFNIPHIYLLSNISIVLRPMRLKLVCVLLVFRNFPILFVIYISLGACVKRVEFSLFNVIYLFMSNEEYFAGDGSS